jgi:hypothetical protein
VILIYSAALLTSDTHSIDFKTLLQNEGFPGKNCVTHTLLQEQMKKIAYGTL